MEMRLDTTTIQELLRQIHSLRTHILHSIYTFVSNNHFDNLIRHLLFPKVSYEEHVL